jgi:hypothetical protein
MRAGTRFDEDYENLDADVRIYEQIYQWRPRTNPDLPEDMTACYPTLVNQGPHGGPFDYRSILTDMLAWVMERATVHGPAQVVIAKLSTWPVAWEDGIAERTLNGSLALAEAIARG